MGDRRPVRWQSAFSPRRTLRALLVPQEGHLRPLDGWRALSILWVVLFHVGWFTVGRLSPRGYIALLLAPWMLPLWRGDFGVDVFFVLSGFLIAGMLIDEQARTGRLRLGLFYARRMLRLWPALAAGLLVNVLVIGDHNGNAWANLLYVSNFLPVVETAMPWTWSLSIEEQFYLVCPGLVGGLAALRGSGRAAALGGAVLAVCAVAGATAVAGGFRPDDAEIVLNRDLGRWAAAFDTLYSKPWMRAGPLFAGVAAAYLYRVPRAMEALAGSRIGATLGLAAAAIAATLATHWPVAMGSGRGVEIAYLAGYRSVFGASVAYLILMSLSQHPVGRLLGRALSVRALYPFAQLAYAAYLLNPIVTQKIHDALAPLIVEGGARAIAILAPLDAAGTFLAAAALHFSIERPIMELRPRSAN